MKKKKTDFKKKKGQKIKEESEIEEKIIEAEKKIEEKSPEIENFEFEEFLQEPEFQRTSPSLRKVNAPQRDFISLEEDLTGTTHLDKKEKNDDSDSFKYSMGGANPEEPKYHSKVYMIFPLIQCPHATMHHAGTGQFSGAIFSPRQVRRVRLCIGLGSCPKLFLWLWIRKRMGRSITDALPRLPAVLVKVLRSFWGCVCEQ